MSTEWRAWAVLVGVPVGLVAFVLWRALRSPNGWRFWLLDIINGLYCGFWFRWRALGNCPFDRLPSALFIANHTSPVDPQLIWAGVRHRRVPEFLTAREYCELPALKFITETMRCIPVARDGQDHAAVREALRRLKRGALVGVFPEGRINTTSELLPGNSGVAWLALRAGVPVFPVYVHNAPRGTGMVDPFFKYQRVWVSFGEQIDLSDYLAIERPDDRVLQEVTQRMMDALAELGRRDRERLYPTSPPGLIWSGAA